MTTTTTDPAPFSVVTAVHLSENVDLPRPLRLTARGRFVRDVASALAVSSFFAVVVIAFSVLEARP